MLEYAFTIKKLKNPKNAKQEDYKVFFKLLNKWNGIE